ncbi:MAG TPA: response regulator [Thermoanaerobaculia bacterium]|nr:response regulator [Thermoanaerobaculia bacterium]
MTRQRILLVDDDAAVLDSLAIGLEDRYHVLVARNGAEALEVLRQQSPDEPVDAVVLDLYMPVLDGEGFLREYFARGGAVPVILASAALDLGATADRTGAADWLQKPFSLRALEAKIDRVTAARPPAGTGGTPPAAPSGGTSEGGGGGGAPRSRRRDSRPYEISTLVVAEIASGQLPVLLGL